MINKDMLPQQFHDVKDADEEFIWIGEPAFLPFISTGIPFLIIVLLWGAMDYFGLIIHMKGILSGFAISFFAMHLFSFWGSVLNMFCLVLVHKNTFYAITNKRVMIRSGF